MNLRLKYLKRSRQSDVDPAEILDVGRRLIEMGAAKDDEGIKEIGDDLVRLAICLQEDIVFRQRPVTGWMGTSFTFLLIAAVLGAFSVWAIGGYALAIAILVTGFSASIVLFAWEQSRISTEIEAAVMELRRLKDNAFTAVVTRRREAQDKDSTQASMYFSESESANNMLALHALGEAFSQVGQDRDITEWKSIGADLIAKATSDPLADTVAHVGEARGWRKTPLPTDGGS